MLVGGGFLRRRPFGLNRGEGLFGLRARGSCDADELSVANDRDIRTSRGPL